MHPDRKQLEAERELGHGWGDLQPDRLAAVNQLGRSSVLDVGCSSGRYVQQVSQQGGTAVGVDLLADAGWVGSSLAFANADARHLPFKNSAFDAVIAFETLEHVPEPDVALLEWSRVSRRHLILSVPNGESPYWSRSAGLTYRHFVDRTHVNVFDADELTTALERAGFTVDAISPILPIHPFVPALDALGLPPRLVQGVGRRLTRLALRRRYAGVLAIAHRR